MRIGIDARMMTPRATRGIGRYVEELIRAMLELAPNHHYVLVTRLAIHAFSSHPSVETRVADVPWYGLAEQLRMPGVFKSLKADIVHVPHWNVPILYHGPLVLTLHDLLLHHEPTSARISTRQPWLAALKRWGYRLTLTSAIQHAKKILVPTEFTANDLKTLYPQAAAKVVVTGEGMGRKHIFPAGFDNRPPLSKFILYVGSAYPHKGLNLLIDAWEAICSHYPDMHLKIAGDEDVFMERIRTTVQQRKLPRVDFLGYVPDEELQRLYHDAQALIFPSRFEGFGLPPLEAIQAGCPVVSSDAAALPEVLGQGAAHFFKSGSKTDIIRAIEEVLKDTVAARAQTLAVLPLLQARHDWKQTARRTLEAYEQAE